MDSFYMDLVKNEKVSGVVKALGRLEGILPAETEEVNPNGLYRQNVIIQIGSIQICNTELDCEFTIPFDDDTEANEAEILLYNLSEKTISGIRQNMLVTITAGYGKDTGIIFSGYLSRVKSYRSSGDKVTEVNAIDSFELKERELTSKSYIGGTKASRILQDLIQKVGLPVATFCIRRDFTYQDKSTVDGGLMENIKKYAQVCGVSAYICKSQIFVRPIQDGDNLTFSLSSDTGLLELSEFEEEIAAEDYIDKIRGYEVEMLLQHRITTASILRIHSKNAEGLYRVREGSHTFDGTNFITKVKAIECPMVKSAATVEAGELPDLSSYTGSSIVDALKSVGADSSYGYRKRIAEKAGIRNYSGSTSQNRELLRKLGVKD